MKQLLIATLLSLICTVSYGQTRLVTGYVFNEAERTPVQGAEVVDLEKQGNIAITDSAGRFTIETASKSLEIRHISYSSEVVRVKGFVNGTRIFLAYGYGVALDITVVGADRSARTMKEQTVSVEVVNPNLIKDKNPIQISEIANQVSGVVISDKQVSIRNGAGWSYGAGTRTLVLVDGMPLMSGDAGQVQWSFISTDNISSMEVVKGASSVLYGSSALNGIINIGTSWPSAKPATNITMFSGVFSEPERKTLKWTSDQLTNSGTRVTHSRRIGKNDLVLTGEYIDENGYRFGDFERRAHGGIDYRRRTKYGLVWGARTHLLTSENGSFLLWKSYDSAYNALNDQTTKTDGLKFRFDPFVKYVTKKGWSNSLKGRILTIDNQVDNGDTGNNQSNKSVMQYLDYQSYFRPVKGVKITFGGTLISTETNSPLYEGTQTATNRAAFVQFDHKVKRLSYTLGGRLENYSLNDYKETKPVFRCGVNLELAKATFLRMAYGQGYRFPTIAESYIKTTVGLLSIYPNPELKSETGDNLEIGIKQGFRSKRVRGFLDMALYRMRYQDMIEFTFAQWSNDLSPGNGFGLGFMSLNTGATTISGIDISTMTEVKVFKGKVRLFGGYNAGNPVVDNPSNVFAIDSVGKKISYLNTSSDTTNGILKYRSLRTFKMDVSYAGKRLEGGISWRYSSHIDNIDKAFVDQFFETFVVKGIQQGMDLNPKGVWVTDVRVSYWITSKIRFGLIINNLGNKEYVVRPADIAPPRMVMGQLKLKI